MGWLKNIGKGLKKAGKGVVYNNPFSVVKRTATGGKPLLSGDRSWKGFFNSEFNAGKNSVGILGAAGSGDFAGAASTVFGNVFNRDRVSGGINFGKNQSSAWIPIIVVSAIGLFLLFRFTGLFGKK